MPRPCKDCWSPRSSWRRAARGTALSKHSLVAPQHYVMYFTNTHFRKWDSLFLDFKDKLKESPLWWGESVPGGQADLYLLWAQGSLPWGFPWYHGLHQAGLQSVYCYEIRLLRRLLLQGILWWHNVFWMEWGQRHSGFLKLFGWEEHQHEKRRLKYPDSLEILEQVLSIKTNQTFLTAQLA